MFNLVKKIPHVQRRIAMEVSRTAKAFRSAIAHDLKPGMSFVRRLPPHGHSAVCIIANLSNLFFHDPGFDIVSNR